MSSSAKKQALPVNGVLIADDEAPARRKAERLLKAHWPDVQTFEAADGLQALEVINERQPDLVLLDIRMPGLSGIELIETIGMEQMPVFIFITAHEQHALEAFDLQASDYLLKPFDQDRLSRALERACSRLSPAHVRNTTSLAHNLEKIGKSAYSARFIVRENHRLLPIEVADIVWLEADDKYVLLHTEARQYCVRHSLDRLARRLDPERFVRTHRGAVVNLSYVEEMQPVSHGDFDIRMTTGAKVRLSRRYAHNMKAFLLG